MGDLLDNAFETPSIRLTDGNQGAKALITSTDNDAWIDEPDAPVGSVHYKSDGTRQTRTQNTGSGVADDWAIENPNDIGGGASVSFSWRFSTSTIIADPGNGRLRFDNAVPANVTQIAVDDFDNSGIDVSGILNQIPSGSRVYIQQADASGSYIVATVDTITDNTGWFTLDVTILDSGTLPANNKIVGVLFFAGGTFPLNANDVLNTGLSTGIVDGGVLSIGAPNTTFSISDGFGFVIDNTTTPTAPTLTKVTWSGLTNIPVTAIGSQLITFVSIDNTGTVIQQGTRWSREQTRDRIIIGVVVHVDLATVDAVNNEQATSINLSPQIGDIFDGLGFINVNGNVFSPNGANLNIDKSVGVMMNRGVNWDIEKKNPHHKTLAALVAATFQYRFQNGTNGATGIAIDPDIYDVGGTSTPVPNNRYTVQRIYSFVSNNVKIQPGQALYTTLADAEAGIQTEPFVTEPSIAANGLLRGFLVVKSNTTDLTDTSDAMFVEASKFGGTGVASGGGVTDSRDLIASVQKGSAGTITPGQVVYISGFDVGAQVTEVELADATTAATMPAFGIARDTIDQNSSGIIVISGLLSNQNTAAWSVGDDLYVDTTAGALTNVRPTGSAEVQKVAVVARSDAALGELEVFGAGRVNDLPNLTQDSIWIGDATGVPVELLNNYDATTDPLVTDDNVAGYAVGSRWINVTLDKEFVALDVSTGAAVWVETTGAGGASTFLSLSDTPGSYAGAALDFVRVNAGETALEFVTLVEADNAAVQARRTTDFTITGTFGDITLDQTDVENDTAVVEHDNTNTERLVFNEAGLYLVYYGSTAVASTGVSEASNDVLFRAQANGAGGAVPGSEDRVKTFWDSSIINDDLEVNALRSFLYDATASDFLTLQAQVANVSGTITTVARLTSFGAIRLKGRKGADGAQGPPGSGSTITVEDEDVAVPNTPHSILNFTGAGVTVTDAGGGQADITIPGGGGAGVANDAVQARRTTTFTLTGAGTFDDITLDATDVETDAAVIEHDNVDTDNVDIKATGTYEINYHVPVDTSGLTNGDTWDINGRIQVNDAGGALVGSTSFVTAWQDGSVDGSDFGFFLEKSVIANLTSGDFVTLNVAATDNSGSGGVIGLLAQTTLTVKRLL